MTTPEILVRARNAFKMGEFPLVEKLAQRILAGEPDSAVAYNLLGTVYEKTGRNRKAIEFFQKAVDSRPDYTEAHNNLGVILRKIERYADAIPHLETAISLSPQRGDVYYNLGNVYKSMGKAALAEENFQKAIAVDPAFVPSYINLGTVLEEQGRNTEAVRTYLKGLQVDSNQPRLHYNLGVVYERIGRLKEAREEYEAAVRARPGWAEALNNLGVVQHRLGDERGAEKTLHDVLRADPREARALNNLGVVLAAQGRGDDAVQSYRASIKSNPRYSQAIGNLASVLEEEGRYTEAMEELKKLLALAPGDAEGHLRLASILRKMENFPEAVENDQAVLATQPNNTEALRGLAWELGKMGLPEKALAYYARLEKSAPEDQSFRLDRALLLSDTGKTDLARREVLRYLEAFPDDQRARVLLADIYATKGQKKQAAQTLREILSADPQQKDASYRLAKLYRDLGEPQKAIETMEGLINRLEQSSDPEDMDALSQAMEQYEQTIAEHEKDFRNEREKTIRKLRELTVDKGKPQRQPPQEDALMIEGLGPLEEEAVPIISVGGLEPVFAVREEDEELTLTEVEEPVQEETVAIEDERPPNLMNLLKDQELYTENPALEMFRPPPPLPSQQQGASQGQAGSSSQPSLDAPQAPSFRSQPVPQQAAPSAGQFAGQATPGGRSGFPFPGRPEGQAGSPFQGQPGSQGTPYPGQYAGQPGSPFQGQSAGQPGSPFQGQSAGQPGSYPSQHGAQAASSAPGQPLTPQGENVLARSLKESVETQQRMVNRLFDEISDLSRRIEEQKRPPQVVPIVLNPPAARAAARPQAPLQPVMVNYPPAPQPAPEGLPRFAAEEGDVAPRPQDVELAEAPGFGRGAQKSGSSEPSSSGRAPMPLGPEELEAAGLEELEAAARGARPASDAQEEAELLEEPVSKEEPQLLQEPAPAQEPEPFESPAAMPIPEQETTLEEVPEDLAPLEPAEETTELKSLSLGDEEGPAELAGPQATAEPAASRPADEVRKELREYIHGVQEKLEGVAGVPSGSADLLDYLQKLSDYLPERDKQQFLGSSERLAMESLKSRLAGSKGLRRAIAERYSPAAPRKKEPLTRPLVVDTFSYLKDLAAWHPDGAVGSAMKERIESLVTRMGRAG